MRSRGFQLICSERFEDRPHASLRRLGVSEDVAALLRVDARDAVSARVVRGFNACESRAWVTYSRLLDSLSAIGATGSMMVSHVAATSTSRMALRETFFRFDLEPRVATSLEDE